MLSRSVPNARRHRPVATPAIISHNPCLCDEANSARSDTTSLAALRAGPNLGAMVGHLGDELLCLPVSRLGANRGKHVPERSRFGIGFHECVAIFRSFSTQDFLGLQPRLMIRDETHCMLRDGQSVTGTRCASFAHTGEDRSSCCSRRGLGANPRERNAGSTACYNCSCGCRDGKS